MSTIIEQSASAGSWSPPEGTAFSAFLDELAAANAALEGAAPDEVLAWAYDRFGDDLLLTSSFQDCVLVDLAAKVRPGVEVVFLDTGFHFPETIAYLHRVEKVLGVHVQLVRSGLSDDEHPCGTARCCELRKVVPLRSVLQGRAAWVTGVKRVDTPERADAATVAWDAAKSVVKINPLASWTEEDVEAYVEARGLPRHPLNYVGYASIGCAPVTRPVAEGEDPRAGRWSGSAKTECGLHV
ncbi:MAG: phosphoadenosine phosphosulfate reductase [Acidimicrobiaceae bacterium]|nr:phosphoadenosine phosphosulfate reductase [Acidimicrobiaceae bacterium]